MDLQKFLERKAEENQVRFHSIFVDLLTEMKAECIVCKHEWEDFPQKFKNNKWCSECDKNPTVRCERAIASVGMKITFINLKNMYDFLVEKDSFTSLVYIAPTCKTDTYLEIEKAQQAGLKLILLDKDFILSDHQALCLFLEDCLSHPDNMLYTYDKAKLAKAKNFILPAENNKASAELDNILDKCNLKRKDINWFHNNSFCTIDIDGVHENGIAVGYCRVSSIHEQAIQGYSLITQIETITKFAKDNKMHLRCIYVDGGVSGGKVHRPALDKLMEDLNEGMTVIVSTLNRLSRNLYGAVDFQRQLENKKCFLQVKDPCIDTSNINGKLVFGILMSIAEYERVNGGKRISEVMSEMKKQGKNVTKPPYGYTSLGKGNIVRNEKEQAMIAFLKKLRQTRTDMTLNQMCHFLDELEDPCRRKALRWHTSTLTRIFINNNIPLPEDKNE